MTRTILTTAALLLSTLTAQAAPPSHAEEVVAVVTASVAVAKTLCTESFEINGYAPTVLASVLKVDTKSSKGFRAATDDMYTFYIKSLKEFGPAKVCEALYNGVLGPNGKSGQAAGEMGITLMTRK